MTYYFKIC